MKILNLDQNGSESWHAWRRSVITATTCSCIMGSNPWNSAYQTWQRLLGLIPEQEENEAMRRGKNLENIARLKFIEDYGVEFQPVCVESSQYNFLGASLDGISKDHSEILEIKCGKSSHEQAAKGEIPLYYQHQIAHQLLCTGAKVCHYYSFDGQNGIHIRVYPDPAFEAEYLPRAREFWACVANLTPPLVTDRDYKSMDNNASFKMLAMQYKSIDEDIKILESRKDAIKKKIIELAEDQPSYGAGIKLMKVVTKGRIAYDELPMLKGIDLDKYRKEPTASWKILIDSNKEKDL